jgi:dTDP-glucose pyrophosphorylase
MNIVSPMAGSDEPFRRHGFPFSKSVTEIDGRPLIEHAFDCLKSIDGARFAFVIRKEDDMRFHLRDVLNLLAPGAAVIRADGETAGAACTALLAVEHMLNDDELIIANGDQILNFDVQAAIQSFRDRDLDAGTIVFDSVHPRWSFVKTDEEGFVVEASEKRPISRNATAGIFYYRKGRDFVEAAQIMIRKDASVNGAYFVCPTFNELILAQKRIGIVKIDRDQYISLATPQAIEEYEQVLAARKRSATA